MSVVPAVGARYPLEPWRLTTLFSVYTALVICGSSAPLLQTHTVLASALPTFPQISISDVCFTQRKCRNIRENIFKISSYSIEQIYHSNRRCPVTSLINFTGAAKVNLSHLRSLSPENLPGPIPSTVREPAAICVRPLGKDGACQGTIKVNQPNYARIHDRPSTEVHTLGDRFKLLKLVFRGCF